MISYLLKKIVGSQNEREVKKLGMLAERINALEETLVKVPTPELCVKTEQFRELIRSRLGSNGDLADEKYFAEMEQVLEEILPEAFAAVREASRRTIAMRHFDVQMIGGMVLHRGSIAEMRTGEGKTLVAVLPLYLNALAGLGSHLITVNDYLAARGRRLDVAGFHGLGYESRGCKSRRLLRACLGGSEAGRRVHREKPDRVAERVPRKRHSSRKKP